jgi:ribosomal protein L11 methyltransferase
VRRSLRLHPAGTCRNIAVMEGREFIEVRLRTRADSGELLGALSSESVLGSCEEEGVTRLYWPAELWEPDNLDAIRRALRALGQDPADSGIEAHAVPDRDWNEGWLRSLQPLRVGRIWIRQSWNAVDLKTDEFELVIDPERAFGSGYHPTTRMLLEWLQVVILGGERVLDIGTGSGVLAMAALRLGCGYALGIEPDSDAFECAARNARANGFGPELELREAAARDLTSESFDLVLANLDRNTVLASPAPVMDRVRAGGWALVSGLQLEDRCDVAGALAAAGGIVREHRTSEGWLALRVEKQDAGH